MRCLIGFVMFVVLYFGTNFMVAEIASGMAHKNEPHLSQKACDARGAKVMHKYHGLVGFGVFAFTITACGLPTAILRWSERKAMNGMTTDDLYR